MSASQLDHIVRGYRERAEKAEAKIEHLKKTLEMERELYRSVRELSKSRDREIDRLNEYIEELEEKCKGKRKKIDKN